VWEVRRLFDGQKCWEQRCFEEWNSFEESPPNLHISLARLVTPERFTDHRGREGEGIANGAAGAAKG
jgi:hypothetical protein